MMKTTKANDTRGKQARRDFLRKAAALGVAGITLAPAAEAVAAGRRYAPRMRRGEAVPVRLGVASYSLRKFSRPEALTMIKEIGTPHVNVKSFHLPYDSTPAEMAAARRAFEQAGLQIVGGGNITIKEEDDAAIRSYFDYAQQAGMPLMVITPTPQNMPRIEHFVKEYDIKVAIHNHGPEAQHFHAPQDALEVIRDMDPRVGVCVDVGHTARTGADVVQAIAEAGDRVLDMHMKDLKDMSLKESQCIVGEGKMPIAGIFEQLETMNYPGYVNLEYEINPEDPLPGMKQSFAYMRGVLAGMKGRTKAE